MKHPAIVGLRLEILPARLDVAIIGIHSTSQTTKTLLWDKSTSPIRHHLTLAYPESSRAMVWLLLSCRGSLRHGELS